MLTRQIQPSLDRRWSFPEIASAILAIAVVAMIWVELLPLALHARAERLRREEQSLCHARGGEVLLCGDGTWQCHTGVEW